MKRIFLLSILFFSFAPSVAFSSSIKIREDLDFGRVRLFSGLSDIEINSSTGAASGGDFLSTYRRGYFEISLDTPKEGTFTIVPYLWSATLTNGSSTLTLFNNGSSPAFETITLPGKKKRDFYVGGVIPVDSNATASGLYTGTLQILVSGGPQDHTIQMPVSIYIIRSTEVKKISDMDFGILYPGLTTSTIRLTPDGIRSVFGGDARISGNATAGTVVVYGEPNTPFNISIPSSMTLTNSNQTEMILSRMTQSPTPYVFDANGRETVGFGGDITLPSTQESGVYNGFFTITITH